MAKTYTLLRKVEEELKPLQVRVILETLQAKVGVGHPMKYEDLLVAVDANPDFKSRQGAKKVVRYYEEALSENGHILVEGTDKPEPRPNPPKKIKAPKAEGATSEPKAAKRSKEHHSEQAA